MTSVTSRADQRQHLHEAGEGIGDEGAAEGAALRRRNRPAMTPATISTSDGKPGDQPVGACRRDRRRASAAPARRPRRSARDRRGRGWRRGPASFNRDLVNSPPPSCAALSEAVTLLTQRLDRGRRRIEDRRRIDAEEDDQHDQRIEDRLLARREVEQALQAFLGQRAEDHPAVEPERVGGRQDHAGGGEERHPGVDPEDAEQRQELADEAGGAGQADIGHGEDHEDDGIFRHVVDQPAIGGDLARVHAVVDDADAQEQRARDEAVRQHLEDRALDALGVHGEDAHRHEAHMGDRGIGDQLLHVLLHQRDQRGVDDRHDRQREDQRREIGRGEREHRQREAQEAVAAHLQQDARPG